MKKRRRRKKKKGKTESRKRILYNPGCFILVFFFLFCPFFSQSQEVERVFNNRETAYYGAFYRLNLIWIKVGEVAFFCDSVKYQSHPAWHFKAVGKTLKFYDMFYSVRDTFESFLTYKDFNPLSFERVLNQGNVHSHHQYNFFPEIGIIKTWCLRDDVNIIKGSIPYIPDSYDMLTSAYYFRSYNFDHMGKGQKIFFNMIVDNKNERSYFKYLGKEITETDSGKKFMCHKICVCMMKGDFFPEGESMKVWFTADKNKLPLRVETKILVGSVRAVLMDVRNTKYPLNSEIK